MSQCWGVPVRLHPEWVHSESLSGYTSASHSIIRLVVLRLMMGKLSHQALKTEKPGSF